MVRDGEAPGAAFVFAGIDGSGETLVLYRHEAGAQAQAVPVGAPGANKWFRLVVGRDTVYAYDAAPAVAGRAGAWNFLAAVKIELAGGEPRQRRADLGGLFVSHGEAAFHDLAQTERVAWSERTARIEEAVPGDPGEWTAVAPAAGQYAESASLLAREDGAGAAHIDFPLAAGAPGGYDFFLHAVSGNGSPLKAALVVGGVAQPEVTVQNEPAGLNAWLYVGHLPSLAAQSEVAVRLVDEGGAARSSTPTPPARC